MGRTADSHILNLCADDPGGVGGSCSWGWNLGERQCLVLKSGRSSCRCGQRAVGGSLERLHNTVCGGMTNGVPSVIEIKSEYGGLMGIGQRIFWPNKIKNCKLAWLSNSNKNYFDRISKYNFSFKKT
jgi:hypothetical protein